MRLEEFHLEGFGHFHQHTVGPLDRNVNVLYGPNEAGKSTLLAFVRAVLFGFPQRGRNQYYPPLAGGRHGGRIRLVDDNGARYTLERFTGTQGGPFDLRAEVDGQLQDTAFLHKLTGHASADLFKNVFAFSLDEIQSEGLMSNSEVSGRIYSAGMGASRLPDFAQSLAKRKEALYRPRGSAQQIAEILRELETTDQQLPGNPVIRRSLSASHQQTGRNCKGAGSGNSRDFGSQPPAHQGRQTDRGMERLGIPADL